MEIEHFLISEIPFSHKDEIVKGLGLGQTLIYIWQKSATRRLVPNGQKRRRHFSFHWKWIAVSFSPRGEKLILRNFLFTVHLYYMKTIKCYRGKLSNLWWALFILSYIKLNEKVKVLTSARVGRILLSHLNKNVFLIQQMKIYSRENDQCIYSSLWKQKRKNFPFCNGFLLSQYVKCTLMRGRARNSQTD